MVLGGDEGRGAFRSKTGGAVVGGRGDGDGDVEGGVSGTEAVFWVREEEEEEEEDVG